MKRGIYVASSKEQAYYGDQHKVLQPYQGGGSDTVKTKEHPEYKQIAHEKRENLTDIAYNPMLNSGHRGHHGHGVTFIKAFMVGFFIVANTATITVTYLIWCPKHKEGRQLMATRRCETN